MVTEILQTDIFKLSKILAAALSSGIILTRDECTIICIPVQNRNGRGLDQKWVGLTGNCCFKPGIDWVDQKSVYLLFIRKVFQVRPQN